MLGLCSLDLHPQFPIHRPGQSAVAAPASRLDATYGKLPLSFEANQGQTDSRVKFLAHGRGYSLFLTGNEAVLTLEGASQNANRKSQNAKVRAGLMPTLRACPEPCEGSAIGIVAQHPLFGAADLPDPLSLSMPTENPENKGEKPRDRRAGPALPSTSRSSDSGDSSTVLRMRLVGANASGVATGADELPGKSNYFIGNDPKKWRTDVATYAKVKYQNVYPGVDAVYYGNQGGQLEYDFVVAPGADPRASKLDVGAGLALPKNARSARTVPDGSERVAEATGRAGQAQPLQISADGDLLIKTDGGEVRFHKPIVYQPDLPSTASSLGSSLVTRHPSLVDGHYVLQANNQVGFKVAPYDHTRPLVIDPVLSYSTYLGGSVGDGGSAIAVDASGNTYVTGFTFSTDFPTVNPVQTMGPMFVSKLNAEGSALAYSTYLGGSGADYAQGIALDASGNGYVVGYTYSSDFPTVNPFQASLKGYPNAFVAKLSAAGSALVYSTYLGGSSLDQAYAIAVDASGNAYITGETQSGDFPTVNPFQASLHGARNVFVTKFDATGSALIYSTYLGGSVYDVASGVAVDSSGNAYVAGSTTSTDFPTVNPFQASLGAKYAANAFVTKLSANGSTLIYSTYLGGSALDGATGIAVDSSGNAYLTGSTYSTDFPTVNPLQQSNHGGYDAFVAKLNSGGSALIYSTYLGGSYNDWANAIALDASGNAYVAGQTYSTDFPTVNPLQAYNLCAAYDCYTAFVAELNASGTSLVYSTYLGGSEYDQAYGIAVDASGNAYVDGETSSPDFPTANPFQANLRGFQSAFVTKISPGNGLPTATPTPGTLTFAGTDVGSASSPQIVTLTNTGTGVLTINSIGITGTNSGDFGQTTTCGASLAAGANCPINVTFAPTAMGIRTGTLTIYDNASGSPQTVSLTGTALQGTASLSTTSLTFGNQPLNMTSGVRPVTVTNTGTAPLTVSSVVTSAEYTGTSICTSPVNTGGTCTVNITFTPSALGTQTGTVTLYSNASNGPQVVNLTGKGFAGAALSCTNCVVGGFAVGSNGGEKIITLANAQNVALTNISISITGSNDYSQTNTCGTAPGARQTCAITVTFTPSIIGVDNATLTVADSAANTPQTAALMGAGLASAGQAARSTAGK
jgi:hypothetical protein